MKTKCRSAAGTAALGMAVNAALAALKLAVGILARSGAMVSDAAHSACDVFAGAIVLFGVKAGAKPPDAKHPFGHTRFECLAELALAGVLFATGAAIALSSVGRIFHGEFSGTKPSVLALCAAAVPMAVKEFMFRFAARNARRLGSGALMADARHHRSDALASLGAFAGICGAFCGLAWVDAAAGAVISVFIVKSAVETFRDSAARLVDRACPEEEALERFAASREGILGARVLTRETGRGFCAEVEIILNGETPLALAESLARELERAIKEQFPRAAWVKVSVRGEICKYKSRFPSGNLLS